jgi:hypothetical protein
MRSSSLPRAYNRFSASSFCALPFGKVLCCAARNTVWMYMYSLTESVYGWHDCYSVYLNTKREAENETLAPLHPCDATGSTHMSNVLHNTAAAQWTTGKWSIECRVCYAVWTCARSILACSFILLCFGVKTGHEMNFIFLTQHLLLRGSL